MMLLYLFLYCPVQCQVLVSAVSSRRSLLAVIKVRGSESPSQTIAQSTSVVFSVAYAVFYGVKFLALPPTLKPGGPGSLFVWPLPMGGGGEGTQSHMKQTGMLVVSLRGVLGKAPIFYVAKVSLGAPQRNTKLRGAGFFRRLCLYIIKTHCMSSLLGVKIYFSQAQIGLL